MNIGVALIAMFILGAIFMFCVEFIIILYLYDHAEDAEDADVIELESEVHK